MCFLLFQRTYALKCPGTSFPHSPRPWILNSRLSSPVLGAVPAAVADTGERPGGARLTLFLDQTEAWRAEILFFLRLAPLVSGSGWLLPSHLIWRSGSAGQQRERYVLLARQFWLLYLTLSNKPEWKKYPKIRPISSSFQTFSLTWSPFPPESYLKSETKIETDLRLWKT